MKIVSAISRQIRVGHDVSMRLIDDGSDLYTPAPPTVPNPLPNTPVSDDGSSGGGLSWSLIGLLLLLLTQRQLRRIIDPPVQLFKCSAF